MELSLLVRALDTRHECMASLSKIGKFGDVRKKGGVQRD
jgi:hypothetical protein